MIDCLNLLPPTPCTGNNSIHLLDLKALFKAEVMDMVIFKYALNQDNIELQASNWSGLEQMFINGKRVSRKLNFGQHSQHDMTLHDGKAATLLLLLEPNTDQLVCHIYKQNNLVASLTQPKKEPYPYRQLAQQAILSIGLVLVFLLTMA